MKSSSQVVGETTMRASQQSFNEDFWKMTIMALVAGASERLVPSLLRQLSDRAANEKPESTEIKTG